MRKWSIIVLLGLVMLGCESIVNKLVFYPDRADVIPAGELPDGIEEITITAKDNVKITSLYLPSPKSEKIVIYFHGNAGNIYHRIPGLLQLRQSGVSVIGVSYRGYGKSEGTPSEKGIYLDGEAVYRYAVKQLGFAPENIIIFGRSIGTAVAVNTAQNQKVRGVILVTPLTSGKEQARAGGLGLVAPLAGDAFDNLSKMEGITSPLLVLHGTDDRIIPYAMGKKIFDKADVEKEFVTIEGADHNDLQDAFAQKYWPPIVRFIKSV